MSVIDHPVRPTQPQPSLAITRAGALWFAIALIAALGRLLFLEVLPLNTFEASYALDALALARDEAASTLNPLLAATQALLFTLGGASDFAARLVPALAGIGFALFPFFLRTHIGHARALWLSFFLALSPTLWFVARQAEGAMLAWALAFATFCAWKANNQIVSGVLMGLLVASGRDAITPLLVLVAARLADRMVALDWRRFGTAATISVVLGSTGLLFRPAGLGDVFNGLAAWFAQLTQPGPFVVGRLLMGFALYEPMLYLTALLGLGHLALGRLSWRAEAVSLARLFVGVVLVFVMQGRTPSNLVPLVIGLAGLAAAAASAITQNLHTHATLKIEGSLSAIALVLCLLVSLAVRQYAASSDSSWLLLALVAVIFGLALLAFGNMLGAGFGIGLRAIGLALGVVLLLHTVAAAVQLNHTRPANPAEPYVIAPATPELRALAETVQQKSSRVYGEIGRMPIDLSDNAPTTLRWLLRDMSELKLRAPSAESAAAITPETQPPPGQTAFVGAAFVAQRTLNLNSVRCNRGEKLDCAALARWVAFREAGAAKEEAWVFWLRQDVAALASGNR
jgi:hypothetical protein